MSSPRSAALPEAAKTPPIRVWVPPWPLGRLAAIGWIIPWLALVIADVVVTPPCVDSCSADFFAPTYWLTGLPITALIVPVVMVVSPRVGVWFAAAVAAGLAAVDSLATWWFTLAVALLGFAVARGIVGHRNRVAARACQPEDVPEEVTERSVPPARLSALEPPRLLRSWLPALLVAIALMLGGWHQVRWEEDRSVGRFAGPSSRVVVIDGDVKDLQIPPGATVVVKGDFSSASGGGVKLEVWIITKPEPEWIPPEPSDPSWLLGLAVGLLGIALAVRARYQVSQRQGAAFVAGAWAQPARIVAVGSAAAIISEGRAVGLLRALRPDGFAAPSAGSDSPAGSASSGVDSSGVDSSGADRQVASLFDSHQQTEVIGSPVGEGVVVLAQGEAMAMARLSDPWPLWRLVHRGRWARLTTTDVDHGDLGEDDLGSDLEADLDEGYGEPEADELPADVPLL